MRPSLGICAGLLAFALLACAGSPGDTSESVEAVEERSFPTLEPFLASRMANFVFAEGALDEVGGDIEEFLRTGEVFRVETKNASFGTHEDEALIALSSWERSWAAMIPVAVSKLEAIFEKGRKGQAWARDDFRLAATIVTLFQRAPESWSPLGEVDLGSDELAGNVAGLETMLDWFEARAKEPACMAAMIATMDDGPWSAPDWSANGSSTVMDSRSLSSDLEVRILLIEEDLPWCLQGVREGEILWTKRLTQVPAGSLRFSDEAPTGLGPYGYKVHMDFGEYAHVYLSPEGEFLFYFTSW